MWAAIAGVSGLIAGLAGGVIALVAFGLDSITDGGSPVLLRGFSQERSDASDPVQTERRAARVVRAVLPLLATYVAIGAVVALARRSTPDGSAVGVLLTAVAAGAPPSGARESCGSPARLTAPDCGGMAC